MLTMIHGNRAKIENGYLTIDRKFHLGMLSYVKSVRSPITTINPVAHTNYEIMDPVVIRLSDLEYRITTVRTDKNGVPLKYDLEGIRSTVTKSKLIYGGDLGISTVADKSKIKRIMVLEYDFQTELAIATLKIDGTLRKLTRTLRCAHDYLNSIPSIRNAHSLHCNGYPIFDQVGRFNSNRLLYLDSRMSADIVITHDALLARLATRGERPIRLIYSGRFEPMKGSDDVIRTAIECMKLGLNIELHCYGQGSLLGEMKSIAKKAPVSNRIHIHNQIPYPELVLISRSFDIFVCCHVQNDPSCTYLESFGSGLPIVGYGNKMWRRLCEASQVGHWSQLCRPDLLAREIKRLCEDSAAINLMSERARRFALEHTFEKEFARRTDAINLVLEGSGHPGA